MFPQSNISVLILNTPPAELNKSDINNWRYELKNDEFNKCLYLASFMHKNNFPAPVAIITPSGGWRNVAGHEYAWTASAIKYAMGEQWKNSVIYHSSFNFMTWQEQIHDSVKEEFINIRIMRELIEFFESDKNNSGFYLVLDRENSVSSELKQSIYPEIKTNTNTGSGILLCGESLENILNKTGKRAQVYGLECDEAKIPRTEKLSDAHDNFILFNILNKFPFIDNSHNNGNVHLSKQLSDFVQTFKKEPYSLKQHLR